MVEQQNDDMKNAVSAVINPEFALLPEEVDFLSKLSEHTPTMKLSTPERQQIAAIYYRVFTNKDIGAEVLKIDKKQPWKTGEKTKEIDSKINILNALRELSNFSGLHEVVNIGFVLEAIKTRREAIIYLLPRVLIAANM